MLFYSCDDSGGCCVLFWWVSNIVVGFLFLFSIVMFAIFLVKIFL